MYDATVVGARCAGSPLSMLLARMGHWLLFSLVVCPLLLAPLALARPSTVIGSFGTNYAWVRFAALSINSAATWENLARISGYLVVFVLIRELSWRNAARGWKLVWPIIVLAGCEATLCPEALAAC